MSDLFHSRVKIIVRRTYSLLDTCMLICEYVRYGTKRYTGERSTTRAEHTTDDVIVTGRRP